MSLNRMASSCFRYLNSYFTLLLIFLQLFLPFARPLSFKITSFDPGATNILYEGDAEASVGQIELNTVKYTCRVGRATYAEPLHLWDSSTGTLADFTTHFTFSIQIEVINQTIYGNGFAFFLAPVGYPIPPNSAGGFLGLLNSTTFATVSRNQIVMVEFDSYVNPEWDPRLQHVGINNNSIASAVFAPWEGGTLSKKLANVWISYNATTKNLSVFWTYKENPVYMGNSTLSYTIDLKKILPEWVTIGFSAGTGQYVEYNTINSWEFSSNLISGEEGQREKFNRRQRRRTFLVVVVPISFFFFILGAGVIWLLIKRRRTKNATKNGQINAGATLNTDLETEALPKIFSYQELVDATNGFADDRKLGRGGTGDVYKGTSSKLGRLIAVKKIVAETSQYERIFINEVKIISRLIHRNLVQFIGWCHEQGECLLVYDYMPNGSLDTHLFGNRITLPWSVRYKIALGLASALHYLHEDAEQCVLHRDIKPENVLLDTDFSTKLGDFGVAKLVDSRLRTQMTGLVGTFGYMAPEYATEGRASKESDIYSFGVVALEIACGRKTYQDGEYHVPLVRWVWQLYLEGSILNAVDERLNGIFNEDEMKCLLIVGLWCTHPKDRERPKAGKVIKVLKLESTLPELPHDMRETTSHPPPPLASVQVDSSVSCSTSSLNHGGR